jgi:hypothetical protein
MMVLSCHLYYHLSWFQKYFTICKHLWIDDDGTLLSSILPSLSCHLYGRFRDGVSGPLGFAADEALEPGRSKADKRRKGDPGSLGSADAMYARSIRGITMVRTNCARHSGVSVPLAYHYTIRQSAGTNPYKRKNHRSPETHMVYERQNVTSEIFQVHVPSRHGTTF